MGKLWKKCTKKIFVCILKINEKRSRVVSGAGSLTGSESISQRYAPDPHQNVTDLQHWSLPIRVIGENLKALEVAEEKAQQREEEYKKQVVKTIFWSQTTFSVVFAFDTHIFLVTDQDPYGQTEERRGEGRVRREDCSEAEPQVIPGTNYGELQGNTSAQAFKHLINFCVMALRQRKPSTSGLW